LTLLFPFQFQLPVSRRFGHHTPLDAFHDCSAACAEVFRHHNVDVVERRIVDGADPSVDTHQPAEIGLGCGEDGSRIDELYGAVHSGPPHAEQFTGTEGGIELLFRLKRHLITRVDQIGIRGLEISLGLA